VAKRKRRKPRKPSTNREKMLEKAREYTIGTYVTTFVSKDFQRMIRAEYAAKPDAVEMAVVDGGIGLVPRKLGQCVCVTCGKVGPWSGGLGGMHTGHFLASRRFSILFEEDNVAPQCSRCNRYESGKPQAYRLWMTEVRGLETIERLERLKTTSRRFEREELVDMRLEFMARLKTAEMVMEGR
jgi:hypothetical protein